MKAHSLVPVLVLLPALALGQAMDIDGHEGVLSAGATVTLYGSGFGVKSPAAPVLFDDFEQHAADFVFASGWEAVGGTVDAPAPWGDWYYSGTSASNLYRPVVTVTDSFAVDGRGKVLRYRQPTPTPTSYMQFEFEPTGKIFMDMDSKIGLFGDAVGIDNGKPLRITYNNDSYTCLYYNYWCGPSGKWGSAINNSLGGIDPDILPYVWFNQSGPEAFADGLMSEWFNWQFCYEEGSAPGELDGYMKNYFNCRISGERSDWPDRPAHIAPYRFNSLHIGGQAVTTGSGECTASASAGAYTYWDHIYLDTTWQRIEIGNNAVYDNCTERTIQIPAAWNQGEITFTARTNEFHDGDNVWVFVVDENNVPSEGYPMAVNAPTNLPGTPGQPIRAPGGND